jgi:hypothetical protein
MKKDMGIKWKQNDKVGGLQIAIQSCKLLHDTSNAVHDMLDRNFKPWSLLMWWRSLKSLEWASSRGLKCWVFPIIQERIDELSIKELEGTNIPESAQEICRNWLLKISSIRELIPRTIIETTLLRLYFFLDNGVKAKKVLYRLSKTNRCFG